MYQIPKFSSQYDRTMLTYIWSLIELVDHVLALVWYHVFVCVENLRKLLVLLTLGTQTWIVMASRLLLFTVCLAPGWYNLLKYWIFDPFILRNVEYGQGAKLRNLMDIYLPLIPKGSKPSMSSKKGVPVVIFVSGGAWIIGYKLWSALVARGLAALGMLVVVPDYRNFPQGDICDMMTDIQAATEWTVENAHRFGGDADKIVLAGQSAGAHICLTLLVTDYLAHKAKESVVPQASLPTPTVINVPMVPNVHVVSPTRSPSVNDELPTRDTSSALPDCGDDGDESEEEEEGFSMLPAMIVPMQQLRLSSSGDNLTPGGLSSKQEPLVAEASQKAVETPQEGLTRETTVDSAHDEARDRWFSPLDSAKKVKPPSSAERTLSSATTTANPMSLLADFLDVDKDEEEVAAVVEDVDTVLNISEQTPTASSNYHDSHLQVEHPAATPFYQHVKLYLGISGPLDLVALASHLHVRGLDASILHWICRGDLRRYSPSLLLAEYIASQQQCSSEPESILADFPAVALFHGSEDRSIPCSISQDLHQLLSSCEASANDRNDSSGNNGKSVRTSYQEYAGWSHTDAILEAPLAGNAQFFADLARVVRHYTCSSSSSGINPSSSSSSLATSPMTPMTSAQRAEEEAIAQHAIPPLAPHLLVQVARYINPF